MFIYVCNYCVATPLGSVQIEGDFASKEICSLCTREGTDIVFSCFGSAGELNKFAENFYRIHERFHSSIFMSIWKRQANRSGFTISGVYSLVWQPAFQECCVLLEHLHTHTIELALVDKHLKKYRGHQLTLEIQNLFDAVNLINNEKSNTNPSWIEGTVKKIEEYWKLCTYQEAANSVLVLKQTLDLQGDFKKVEVIAEEVII